MIFFIIVCSEGIYGEECKYSCLCKNNVICDYIIGICNCLVVEGKIGIFCDEGEKRNM